jgi:glycosyltransferase involved in cell wall biosynthesis
MKIDPIVTVIMPVYNGSSYLESAIQSIRKQSYKDWELIIINDGSTDDTKLIVNRFIALDSRIKMVNNRRNLGIACSLNKGIRLAKGRYIARQDADDISQPNRLSKQVSFLNNNNDYGLVSSLFIVMSEAGQPIKITALPLDDYEIKLSLLFYNPIAHGSVMIRNSVLKQHNLDYDPNDLHCEDYGLWIKLSMHTKIKILPTPLYTWRLTSAGVTSRNLSAMESKCAILSNQISPKIKYSQIMRLQQKYKNSGHLSINGVEFSVDYKWMYQKLLFNLSRYAYKTNQHILAAKLLLNSLLMDPKNYVLRLPFIPFSKSLAQQKLDRLYKN